MKKFGSSELSTLLILAIAALSPAQAAEKVAQNEVKHTTIKHAAAAPNVQRLGGTGSWSAYIYKERSGRVCYMAGGPQKTEPAKFKRKLPAAMVTHRPEESVANVVSFDVGAPLKDGSDACSSPRPQELPGARHCARSQSRRCGPFPNASATRGRSRRAHWRPA